MDQPSFLESLILAGAIEIGGLDSESGEFLYVFTEKIHDLFPELFENHKEFVQDKIMNLWEQGFVDLRFDDNNDMQITISEKSFDQEELSKLPADYRFAVEEIKRISRLD